jgi:hypothetical protein
LADSRYWGADREIGGKLMAEITDDVRNRQTFFLIKRSGCPAGVGNVILFSCIVAALLVIVGEAIFFFTGN